MTLRARIADLEARDLWFAGENVGDPEVIQKRASGIPMDDLLQAPTSGPIGSLRSIFGLPVTHPESYSPMR